MPSDEPRYSYRTLNELPYGGSRLEVIEGKLLVSPSSTLSRQRVVGRVLMFLLEAETLGHGEAYAGPLDVVFDEHNVFKPDLVFVRKDRRKIVTERTIEGVPDLVVEIAEVGASHRNEDGRMLLYQSWKVPFYWWIDLRERTMRVHELQGDFYKLGSALGPGQAFTCPLFPDLDIHVGAFVFLGSELYKLEEQVEGWRECLDMLDSEESLREEMRRIEERLEAVSDDSQACGELEGELLEAEGQLDNRNTIEGELSWFEQQAAALRDSISKGLDVRPTVAHLQKEVREKDERIAKLLVYNSALLKQHPERVRNLGPIDDRHRYDR